MTTMTPSQQRTIEALRNEGISSLYRSYADKYEYKRFEAWPNGSEISVVITIGRKGDEGTFAESYARDKWHLFIGKRGAVYAYNGRNKMVHCVRRVLSCIPRIPSN